MHLPRSAVRGLRFAISASGYVRKKNPQLFTDLNVPPRPQAAPKLNDYIQPTKLLLHVSEYLSDKPFSAIPFHRPLENSLRGDDAKPWMHLAVGSAANHA